MGISKSSIFATIEPFDARLVSISQPKDRKIWPKYPLVQDVS